MPWKPPSPGAVPTLGYEIIDWIAAYLAAPDRAEREPFVLYPEQEDFVLRFYELNPRTGKRRFRRGVISRPRGWGKSPFLGALACAEALGPVVPAGWDAEGQPVGKPWATVRTPLVQIAAVAESQTKNTWTPLLEMLEGAVDDFPGLELMETFVNLPRGRIEPVTSSARTVKGNRAVFAVLDQTEEWVASNSGLRMAEVMRVNAIKIGGTTIESPNAFIPGQGSVAEQSASFWAAIKEGRARDDGLFYDHREAPAETDIADRESLRAGLLVAYGDSAEENGGHVDLDVIAASVWDPAIDPQVARADFLNQITHASDSWLSQPEWAGCADATQIVADRDVVVLGFDGSRKRTGRGKSTDATALIGCRVSDGHLFEVAVWEEPQGPAGADWQVPTVEVLAAVEQAFRRWTVVGFYADPVLWEGHIASWEAKWAAQLRVKATRDHPIEWWMNRPTIVARALEQFHGAVVDRELSHDGSFALTRHVLSARRRPGRSGIAISKSHPDSAQKIDAAVAAVLAWQARLDAVAAGVGAETGGFVPRRVR